MRVFEIEEGSATPLHTHPWEHEVFILEGKGKLKSGDKEILLSEGDAAIVLPSEQHSFINAGKKLLRLICVVPLVDGKMPGLPTKD
jgi:quercetin dioxygenase-like cupin family protein